MCGIFHKSFLQTMEMPERWAPSRSCPPCQFSCQNMSNDVMTSRSDILWHRVIMSHDVIRHDKVTLHRSTHLKLRKSSFSAMRWDRFYTLDRWRRREICRMIPNKRCVPPNLCYFVGMLNFFRRMFIIKTKNNGLY